MPLPPEIQKKWNILDKKLKNVREEQAKEEKENQPHDEELTEGQKKSARAGSEFLSSVIGGAVLGYGIDWFFGTLPWGMIFFIVMGFVSAVYRANAVMKQAYEENLEENEK